MSKVAQTVLDEFGRAVKRAKSLKGWSLDQLAAEINPPPGKSFLSNIERGKRAISATTVGKLIKALDLDQAWIDRFLDADIAADAEETKQDYEADRLMQMVAKDETAPQTAEALLIALAGQYSDQNFLDLRTAYAALKDALETAAAMKARGQLPQNTDGQLQAVLAEVARLNDLGEFDQAADVLEEEMQRAEAAHEAIHNRQLDQDRIMNRPEMAAKRIIAQLKRSAPAGGVWRGTRDLIELWQEKGDTLGLPFDLHVALHLAKANLARAKGRQQGDALGDLAICQFDLARRSIDDKHLLAAKTNFEAAQRFFPRKSDPHNWGISQTHLGNTLRMLGGRLSDPTLLRRAVKSQRAALTARTHARSPVDWATSQNNLGTALSELGEISTELAPLHEAILAYQAALTVLTPTAFPNEWVGAQHNLGIAHKAIATLTKDIDQLDLAKTAFEAALTQFPLETAPYPWADSHGGLGKVALVRFDLTGDTAQLAIAARYLTEARAVFALDPENRFALECNDSSGPDRRQAEAVGWGFNPPSEAEKMNKPLTGQP